MPISRDHPRDAATMPRSPISASSHRRLGWAVGDRGVIWHTDDGGATWRQQPSPVSCHLNAVFFIDGRRGWAVGGESRPRKAGSRGVVLRTDDGGATWTASAAPRPAAAHRREVFRPPTTASRSANPHPSIRPASSPRATAATPGNRSRPTPPAIGSPATFSIPMSAPSPAPPAKSPRSPAIKSSIRRWPRRRCVRFARCASSRRPAAGPWATADWC